MSALPFAIEALLEPQAYPHKPQRIELVQTQMSLIYLTGEYVYKIKKPVNLGYLDYTTLEKRHFFCCQELELNRRLCPDAYLAVVPIVKENGTLRVGDTVVAGLSHGRVRQMLDEDRRPIRETLPSTPVMILGLSGVPEAGEIFKVVRDERTARAIVAKREEELATKAATPVRAFTLDDFSSRIQAGQIKELNLIVKTDAQGSIEPIVNSLEELGSKDLKVNIIHAAAGNISESDINLAIAARAVVVGFNAHPDPAARRLAENEGVDIRTYDIIYKLIDEVDKALKGLLEPTYEDVVVGEAEVRATFRIPKVGIVAGCYIRQGEARRNARARVFRGEEQLHDGHVGSLKRYEKDVREVREGFECGVGLENFEDFETGDTIQFYVKERQEVA